MCVSNIAVGDGRIIGAFNPHAFPFEHALGEIAKTYKREAADALIERLVTRDNSNSDISFIASFLRFHLGEDQTIQELRIKQGEYYYDRAAFERLQQAIETLSKTNNK